MFPHSFPADCVPITADTHFHVPTPQSSQTGNASAQRPEGVAGDVLLTAEMLRGRPEAAAASETGPGSSGVRPRPLLESQSGRHHANTGPPACLVFYFILIV